MKRTSLIILLLFVALLAGCSETGGSQGSGSFGQKRVPSDSAETTVPEKGTAS